MVLGEGQFFMSEVPLKGFSGAGMAAGAYEDSADVGAIGWALAPFSWPKASYWGRAVAPASSRGGFVLA